MLKKDFLDKDIAMRLKVNTLLKPVLLITVIGLSNTSFTQSIHSDGGPIHRQFKEMATLLQEHSDEPWPIFSDIYNEARSKVLESLDRAAEKDIKALDADLLFIAAYLYYPTFFDEIGMPGLKRSYNELFGEGLETILTSNHIELVVHAVKRLEISVRLNEGAVDKLSDEGRAAVNIYEYIAKARIIHLRKQKNSELSL